MRICEREKERKMTLRNYGDERSSDPKMEFYPRHPRELIMMDPIPRYYYTFTPARLVSIVKKPKIRLTVAPTRFY